jgi:hypothetical protein
MQPWYARRECEEAQISTLTGCTRSPYLSRVKTHFLRTYLASIRARRPYGVDGVVLAPKDPLGTTRSVDQAALREWDRRNRILLPGK